MKYLKSILAHHRTTLFLFLCILAVYGLSYYQRQAGYSEWMESRDHFVVEHVTAMSTTDAYYWLKMARDLDADKLGKPGVIDPLKGYPDLVEYIDNPNLLAHLISLGTRLTDGDYYRSALLLVPLLAGLFVFPLFLYFHHLGFGAAAILGGLIGSFSVAYYARSNHGYVDTDMLNLFFPLAISTIVLLINRERSRRDNLILAGCAGAFMFLFNWWYQQPLFFLVYLFFMAAYLLSARFPVKDLLLLVLLYSLLSGPEYVLQSFNSLRGFLNAYFFPQSSGTIVWPDILATVTEAVKYDIQEKIKRVHGLLPLSLAGLAGLIYLCIVRWKKMIPIAPLVLLGLWSLVGPNRFAMYLAPFIGVGAGALIQLLVQRAARKFDLHRFPVVAISIALMTVLFFSTISYTAYSFVPGAMPTRETIQAYLDIKKLVPNHSAIFTWWDESYALMEIGEFATYNDGQMHAGIRSTLAAKALTSTRQEDLVSLLTYLEESGFKELNTKIIEENLSGDQMMRTVFNHPPEFRGENVYVLLTEEMMRTFGGISYMGTWDFNKKTSSPIKYDLLNCSPQPSNTLTCSEGQIDLLKGVIFDDTHSLPLKAALMIRDGFVVKRVDYPVTDGSYLQILMKQGRVSMVQVLEEQLFQSNFNQQFMLGNYDRRYFEEVYNNFPVARVLKVKQVPPRF